MAYTPIHPDAIIGDKLKGLSSSALRTGDLISALEMLALEIRLRGYQVQVAAVPSNLRLSEPIIAFLFTVSVEGESASIVRVKTAIKGETRSSEAEDSSLFGPMIEMSFAGIQARGQLLGIAVSVESSPGMTTALVIDVPLLGSSDLL